MYHTNDYKQTTNYEFMYIHTINSRHLCTLILSSSEPTGESSESSRSPGRRRGSDTSHNTFSNLATYTTLHGYTV